MHATDAELMPIERLHEIAAIFAAGILRRRTRCESGPEMATSGPESTSGKLPDSAKE